jgi:hypothetical protein
VETITDRDFGRLIATILRAVARSSNAIESRLRLQLLNLPCGKWWKDLRDDVDWIKFLARIDSLILSLHKYSDPNAYCYNTKYGADMRRFFMDGIGFILVQPLEAVESKDSGQRYMRRWSASKPISSA